MADTLIETYDTNSNKQTKSSCSQDNDKHGDTYSL